VVSLANGNVAASGSVPATRFPPQNQLASGFSGPVAAPPGHPLGVPVTSPSMAANPRFRSLMVGMTIGLVVLLGVIVLVLSRRP